MSFLLFFGGLLIIAFIVVVPIAALSAHSMAKRLEAELNGVRMRLGKAEQALARLQQPPAPPPEATIEPEPEPQSLDQAPAFDQAPTLDRTPVLVAAPTLAPPVAPSMMSEQALTEHWMVWLGGITLALGGAFLVKFSVEQGLLGPVTRVALGAIFGLAAIILGHVLAKTKLARLPWHLPPVLVGAGAVIVFASLYAAYGIYHFLDPLAAFAILAVVAAATVLLSLAHGPFVALLGLTGAFVVPLLVRTSEPNVLGLFTYLLLLAASAMALLRWREWWWLAWVTLAGATGWVLIWIATAYRPGDEIVLGVFLCGLAALFAAFRLGIPAIAAFAQPAEGPMVKEVIAIAAMGIAAVALMVISVAHFSSAAQALLLALSVGYLAFARRDQDFDWLPFVTAVMTVAVLVFWDGGRQEILNFRDILARPWPHESVRYAWVGVLFAVLFGGTGFMVAGQSQRPPRWAALSAGTPLAILAATYWRLSAITGGWVWTGIALALGMAFVLAAEHVNRRRSQDGMEGALGAYAIGVVGALALAATIALEEAWLTVSLALMVVGTAWVEGRLRIEGLRRVALILAAIILVRLGLNPYILSYPISEPSVFNWLLYGYGIPALAFLAASRLFLRSGDDSLVKMLEAGAVAFAVALVSLEIRHLMAGGLAPENGYGLVECSTHTIAWLCGAAVLAQLHRRSGRLVPMRGAQVLLALATLQAVLLQALSGNPLLTGVSVGDRTILNSLRLAYAAPAALYGLLVRLVPCSPPWSKQACTALALGFAFLWATLEVRHAFVGGNLRMGRVGQAEMWAYSALYLLGGVLVLVSGIRFRSTTLRHTGLAIVLVVVAKVFLVDLSRTSGLWRALSFLGLGAALIGIGWLYRRFMRAEDAPQPIQEAP